MNDFYVYILECSDGSYYTGHTDDIEARMSMHKLGLIKQCYTYKRRPVKLVFAETFGTRDEAFAADPSIRLLERLLRASGIKGWSRRKKLALIERDFDRLKYLAKSTKAKES